ncbi:MAG: metallophosphoesterase, partial [Ruminiclostridium sp.]|nr:metallophosphoesterase [Ruminiclostridium sp.]
GHAHGRQWRIPGHLNCLLAPNQGFFSDNTGGRYDIPHCTFLVSRGLARESTSIPRLFNSPELVIIDIT